MHTSNWYQIPLQEQLAERLCRLAGMETAFFCNSGAEANEAPIKLARLYDHQREFKQPAIIVTEGSFHGRTLATLSAAGNHKGGLAHIPSDTTGFGVRLTLELLLTQQLAA